MRIAVLFSGGGTTLQNLIDATRDGRLSGVEVVQGLSSRRDVGGIARCEQAGVPCDVVDRRDHLEVMSHSKAVFAKLDEAKLDRLVLAGWMNRLVLPPAWLDERVINVHPSLLPAFGGKGMYGRHVHEAVLARGCKVTGCTVHFVDNGLDTGPIIDQRVVPVEEGDSAESLAARVQAAEREALVDALRMLV
ncbi:MAG: phosphoribosylglycinamide formyltransferase [Planctomycetota bacterium]